MNGASGRAATAARGHSRQKSLTDAFRTIRTRKGSVSANAQEIAEALKAPVSPKLIVG
jgi:solute carrier family 35 protein E1